jgi:hypothetical protein
MVEAVTCQCLQQLVGHPSFARLYCPEASGGSESLFQYISGLTTVLKSHVPEVEKDLRKLSIPVPYFAYRWLAMLFSYEFRMDAVQRIWDSLLAHYDRILDYAFYVSAARLAMFRGQPALANYDQAMTLLQAPIELDPADLLACASAWWTRDHSSTKRRWSGSPQ